jgi:hypothetical protein
VLVTAVAAGPGLLTTTHVNVIDAAGAPVRQDTTVVVTGEGITAVGLSGTVKIPAGARVLDGFVPGPAPAAGLKTCVGCD